MDDQGKSRLGAAAILGLAIFITGTMFPADRYQMSSASGVVYRLDKSTGEVAACIPQRGCIDLSK